MYRTAKLMVGIAAALALVVASMSDGRGTVIGSGTIDIGLNSIYVQSFSSLASTGTSSSLPIGWFVDETGTNANGVYTAGNGSSNTGDTYSFGTSTDRALGTLRSSSVVSTIGAAIRNVGPTQFWSLAISYTGEEWRLGANGRADTLNFQYSFNATSVTDSAATWVDFDSLDFLTPSLSGSISGAAAARNGNASGFFSSRSGTITASPGSQGLGVMPNDTMWIRWEDLDASGADDGLAIDDFFLTPTFAVVPETSPIFFGAVLCAGACVYQWRRHRLRDDGKT